VLGEEVDERGDSVEAECIVGEIDSVQARQCKEGCEEM
jgi:hypothetical protein